MGGLLNDDVEFVPQHQTYVNGCHCDCDGCYRGRERLGILFGVFWVFFFGFGFGSFLVLDDAICVVGECGFSQCTVPRSTVPFPMTSPYMGQGVIFFLLKLFFTHDSRTLPGFALPGVSTTLLFGDQPAVCGVRLRTE